MNFRKEQIFFPKWKKVQVADPGAGVYFCEGLCQFTLLSEGLTLQTKERRALPMYITYSDLVQMGIFICALVGLCYTIFKPYHLEEYQIMT